MGVRPNTVVKRLAAALALVIATPALGPALQPGPLELDPLEHWTVALGTGIDAIVLLPELSLAGIPVAPDGLDSLQVTMGALQGEGILDAAYSAALVGSTDSFPSLLAGGGGSTSSSGFDVGASGNSGGAPDGSWNAANGDGSSGTRGPVASPTSVTPFADTTPGLDTSAGRNAQYFDLGRATAPTTGSPPHGTVGPPWHDPVILAGTPGVIAKDGDHPILGDPPLVDPTNPGNDSLPGPFFTNDSPKDFPPPDITPMGFTPIDDLRLTNDITINAVPEPGTLALLALGLAGLALSRRKP